MGLKWIAYGAADSARHKSLIAAVELPYNCNVIYAHAGGLVNKKQRDEIVAKFTKKFGDNRMVMLGNMLLEYSMAQNKCDICSFKHAPALDVKIDERISLALMYGAGAKKLQEMLGAIRLSNGDVVSIGDIWMIFPMPSDGISEEELADVDMAKADEEWGPNGETVREMIRNLYHCKTDEEVNKYVRRYLAS